jgi:hypothetical protein
MMHVLDYDRALGELLELDDTIRAVMERKRYRLSMFWHLISEMKT